MTTNDLSKLFKSIREENLSRGMLEQYEQQLSGTYAEMMVEIGSLKKEKALFILERTNPETPDVKIKRLFDGNPNGQRLIELEANVKAVGTMMRSIRSRIYQSY